MRILVTGSRGAVGTHLVEELEGRGHQVWRMDRGHFHEGTFLRGDVGEYRQFESVIERCRPELVYHLAAEFGRRNGEDFYETMWKANAAGTKNLLMLQRRHGFRSVLFSSSEVYLHHRRTSTYVADTCRTLANIADRFVPGRVYNVGGEELHDMKSVNDMILEYLRLDDSHVSYLESEPMTTRDKVVDCSRARA